MEATSVTTPKSDHDTLMLALNEMQPGLTDLLNQTGVDNAMNVPDYLLSELVMGFLVNIAHHHICRDDWFSSTKK